MQGTMPKTPTPVKIENQKPPLQPLRPPARPSPQKVLPDVQTSPTEAATRRSKFLERAKHIADVTDEVERLEVKRARYLDVIRAARIQIGSPTWEFIKRKLSPVGEGKSIREGQRIKTALATAAVGRQELSSLLHYRNWLLRRVGDKVGGTDAHTRPAGIEKMLGDVLQNDYFIGAAALSDPKKEAERAKKRAVALRVLKGLKVERPPVLDRLSRGMTKRACQGAHL